jgi:hypothetical protein
MLLQYIHKMFLPHDAIYFVKCTSRSCSKASPQHNAATPMLHGWDGVLRLASLSLFPPNITMVVMAKQFYFCFIRPKEIYGGFGAVASSLLDTTLVLLWL